MPALNQPPVVSRPGTGQRKEDMRLNNLLQFVALGLAVLMATAAFASNKASLHFDEAVEVNGQQLPAGEYQLRWEGAGPNVELEFMQGKKEVARTSAKEIQLDQPSAYDAAVVEHSKGKATVSEIRFAGKKNALALGSSERASMGESSSK